MLISRPYGRGGARSTSHTVFLASWVLMCRLQLHKTYFVRKLFCNIAEYYAANEHSALFGFRQNILLFVCRTFVFGLTLKIMFRSTLPSRQFFGKSILHGCLISCEILLANARQALHSIVPLPPLPFQQVMHMQSCFHNQARSELCCILTAKWRSNNRNNGWSQCRDG